MSNILMEHSYNCGDEYNETWYKGLYRKYLLMKIQKNDIWRKTELGGVNILCFQNPSPLRHTRLTHLPSHDKHTFHFCIFLLPDLYFPYSPMPPPPVLSIHSFRPSKTIRSTPAVALHTGLTASMLNSRSINASPRPGQVIVLWSWADNPCSQCFSPPRYMNE